jgi:DNA polymerase elongation subunit (family B)
MFFFNLILAILPLMGMSDIRSAPLEVEEYCNERFEFCVTYPSAYFSEKQYADNGDGITMYAQEGAVEVDIIGAYNVMEWSVEDIANNYFKSIKEKPMEVELREIYTDEAYGWAKLKYNYEIQLFKINLLDDAYITTIITVPASSPELLDELMESVQLTFTV